LKWKKYGAVVFLFFFFVLKKQGEKKNRKVNKPVQRLHDMWSYITSNTLSIHTPASRSGCSHDNQATSLFFQIFWGGKKKAHTQAVLQHGNACVDEPFKHTYKRKPHRVTNYCFPRAQHTQGGAAQSSQDTF
jgi:hypothetical protein